MADNVASPAQMRTEPITILGQPVDVTSVEGYGPIQQGFFDAFGRAAYTGWMNVENRWAGVRDFVEGIDSQLTPEAWRELVGDRELTYERSQSKNEVQRQISIYDRDQYVARFESRPVAAFFGNIPPYILDFTSVVTFPVGGVNFARAAAAKTWATFMRETAVGDSKLAVAALPLETVTQLATTGEIDLMELSGAVLGSLIAPGVIAASFRALRGLGRLGDGPTADAAAVHSATNPDADPAAASARMAETDEVPAPPVTPRTERPRPTRALIDRDFETYAGGARQFFRDLASRAPVALEKAAALGLDPDSAAFKDAVAQIGEATDARGKLSQDYLVGVLQALRNPTNEARSVLRENGILDAADNIRPYYEDLANAAMKDPVERTPAEQELVTEFIETGAAPARQRALAGIHDEITEVRQELTGLRELTRGTQKKTKRLNQIRARAAKLSQKWIALSVQRENIATGPRVVDDGIPDERLLEILEHARMERAKEPGPEPVFVPEEVAPLANRLRDQPPEGEEMQQWAVKYLRALDNPEEALAGLDDITALFNRVDEAARSCRVG